MSSEPSSQICLRTVETSWKRIASYVRTTPLIQDVDLSDRCGIPLWLKWENAQRTGAFKIRGALSKLLSPPQLSTAKRLGVVAASAGNHGIGVACAASLIGAHATIYVPGCTPRIRVDGIERYGSAIVFVEGGYYAAERAAMEAAEKSGALWVSPYDDPDVIAGQGTLALELMAQCPTLQTITAPACGGGLAAGIGIVCREVMPRLQTIAVQAAASPYMHAAYHGRPMNEVCEQPTVADGLAGRIDDTAITVPLVKGMVDAFALVSEASIVEAMRYAYRKHAQIVEGAGAVALAAALEGSLPSGLGPTALVITGGNIDGEELDTLLALARTCR